MEYAKLDTYYAEASEFYDNLKKASPKPKYTIRRTKRNVLISQITVDSIRIKYPVGL
jgi:hypothetical protein